MIFTEQCFSVVASPSRTSLVFVVLLLVAGECY